MDTMMDMLTWQLALIESFLEFGGEDAEALKMFEEDCHIYGSEVMAETLKYGQSELPNLWRVLNG